SHHSLDNPNGHLVIRTPALSTYQSNSLIAFIARAVDYLNWHLQHLDQLCLVPAHLGQELIVTHSLARQYRSLSPCASSFTPRPYNVAISSTAVIPRTTRPPEDAGLSHRRCEHVLR